MRPNMMNSLAKVNHHVSDATRSKGRAIPNRVGVEGSPEGV